MSEAVDFGALLAEEMTEEAIQRGFVSEEAVPAPVAAQAPQRVVRQETAQAVEEVAEVVEEVPDFDFDPEIPDEITELLQPDEEDFTVPVVEVEESDEWTDPSEVAKLKARLAAAEKKAEYAEQLRLQASRPKWEKEAEKFFPLSDPASIEASSRKEFMRKAAAQHDALKPAIQKFKAQQDAFLEKERERIKVELEAEARQAWGRPLTGPGNVPLEATDKSAALAAARKTGNLEKVTAVLLGNIPEKG